MADGHIKIKIDVDGKELVLTNKDLDKIEKGSRKAGSGIKKFAASLGLVAIGAAAFATLKASMDDAIARFDTLNKFPKVLQSLGVSAEDSERAMSRLADGIDGLPTKLNEIASYAQRMYTSFGDMDKATDTAIALNNALLGSGASAEQAQRGTEAYIKVLQTGTIDLDRWNTFSETMDVGLVKIAESFGLAGKSAKQDLYQALKDGTISLEEFNEKLIEVGTGTGIMAKLARENTLGLATSVENLKTAAVRGLVEIINAFNRMSKKVTGREIAQNIDSLKRLIFTSFQTIAKYIDRATPVVEFFAKAVKGSIPIVKTLSPAIYGLMTAYGAYVVITKMSAAIKTSTALLDVALSATKTLTVATIVKTGATKADTAATLAQTGAVNLSTLALGVLSGRITMATAAMALKTTATYALAGAIRFLTGPIGWIITAVGLLATGIFALVKYMNKATETGKRLSESTEELTDTNDDLINSVKESEKSYKEQRRELDVTERKHIDLAKKVSELAEKEKLSADEKRKLNHYIDQLNDSINNLNLTYDEEAKALNMTSEQLKARIGLMKDLESVSSVQERLNELTEEQVALEMQLEETIKLRKEWDEALKEGTVRGREYTEAVEELVVQERELRESLAEVSEQHKETEAQVKQSMDMIRKAVEDGTASQIISLDMLSEKQQEVVQSMTEKWRELEDATTDMFDTLSDEIEITASEMAKNLEENQRIVSEWADGITKLAERGVDEGLLDKLRAAGPESAGHVKALVNASDEELEHLNTVFKEGGEVATEALAKSLGIEDSGIMEAVVHLVSDTESTLRDEIANAGFDDIGIDVAKGLAEGTKKGTPEAEKASKELGKATEDAARDQLETHSPSKVFFRIGGDVTDGLVMGIYHGVGDVVKAVQLMFQNVTRATQLSLENINVEMSKLPTNTAREMGLMNKIVDASMSAMHRHINNRIPLILGSIRALSGSMPRSFNGLPSQMNFIGLSAMNGLTAGLIRGSRGAINQARYVANQIRSTMQSALKINSPSHVMRDDVGRWIPAGVAEGIKRYSHMIDNAIDDMYNMIVPQAPELAIGANMAVNARGVGFSNDKPSTKTITNNNNPVIHIEKIENYSDSDIPRILEESAWILSREDKRL